MLPLKLFCMNLQSQVSKNSQCYLAKWRWISLKWERIPRGSANVCKQGAHQHTNDEWWCLKNPSSRRGWNGSGRCGKRFAIINCETFSFMENEEKQKPTAGNARDGCIIDSSRIILSFTSLLAHREWKRCTIHQEFIQQALWKWILIVSVGLFANDPFYLDVPGDPRGKLRVTFFLKAFKKLSEHISNLRDWKFKFKRETMQDSKQNAITIQIWRKFPWHLITHNKAHIRACTP